MRAKQLLVEFYDPADDQLAQADYDNTRRPRLTMRHLHKMRIAKDTARVDKEEHLRFLPTMYGTPVEDSGDGF